MEVTITSAETIKPSSLSSPLDNISLKKPFKISLLDQITPSTYGSGIFFYPLNTKGGDNANKLSKRLKASLSDTLTRFYPYSGRVKDNLYVHDFHEGVPYLEARANCQISGILNNPTLYSLNKLLPSRPFHDETSNPDMPVVAFQLTEFECGGVSFGECMSHMITDATTCIAFLKAWPAVTRDMPSDNIINHAPEHHNHHAPDFSEAPSSFPSKDSLTRFYTSTYENVLFGHLGNYRTKRFVFKAEALVTLKAPVRSELVEKPSRVQAPPGFIWKSVMEASRKASQSATNNASPITHVKAQALNIRRRREGQPGTSVGNLFWWTLAVYYEECARMAGTSWPGWWSL